VLVVGFAVTLLGAVSVVGLAVTVWIFLAHAVIMHR
jgi:hypothetical protein